MGRVQGGNHVPLDDRFNFLESGLIAGVGAWDAKLHFATGKEDGERYLLRIFKKTKTGLDQDLRRLVARGLRRIRRIVSSRRARDILVDVVEVVEDREELAIVMRDPGTPLRSGSKRADDRQKRLLVPSERKIFWGNIIRVAEGLTLCHDAGVIHGSVGVMSIFSHRDDDEDYRLGGYSPSPPPASKTRTPSPSQAKIRASCLLSRETCNADCCAPSSGAGWLPSASAPASTDRLQYLTSSDCQTALKIDPLSASNIDPLKVVS
jgi:hypothetical protein